MDTPQFSKNLTILQLSSGVTSEEAPYPQNMSALDNSPLPWLRTS